MVVDLDEVVWGKQGRFLSRITILSESIGYTTDRVNALALKIKSDVKACLHAMKLRIAATQLFPNLQVHD